MTRRFLPLILTFLARALAMALFVALGLMLFFIAGQQAGGGLQ